MPEVTKVSPLRYAFLAALFFCAVAFQATVSIPALKAVWADAQHFHLHMLRDWSLNLNLHFVTPLACLLLGFYVVSVRIWDARAWLLLAVLLSFSIVSDGSNKIDEVMSWRSPAKHLALVYRSVVINSWPLCMLLFAIYFPERAAFDRRSPGLKWAILIPVSAVFLLAVAVRLAMNEGGSAERLFRPVQDLSGRLHFLMIIASLILFLLLLFLKLRGATDADDRRRLRVLFSGLAFSLFLLW